MPSATPRADVDAIGDADEVCVFEFDAGALVAVVEEDVEAGGGEVGGDFFSGGEEGARPDVGDGDDDLEGCDGRVRGRRLRRRWLRRRIRWRR